MSIEVMKQALEFIDSVKVHPTQIATRDALHTALRAAIEQAEKQGPCIAVSSDRITIDARNGNLSIGAPRQWVGLTDDEAMQIWDGVIKYALGEVRVKAFALAIEAKLKEKNDVLRSV